MERDTFRNLLESARLGDWLEALKSDYVPQDQDEIHLISQAAQAAQPELQRAALQVVSNVPSRAAAYLLMQLARFAVEPEVRRDAIQRLQDVRDNEVTETLLICARDQHPEPQEAAICCLGGRGNGRVEALLMEESAKVGIIV